MKPRASHGGPAGSPSTACDASRLTRATRMSVSSSGTGEPLSRLDLRRRALLAVVVDGARLAPRAEVAVVRHAVVAVRAAERVCRGPVVAGVAVGADGSLGPL